LCKTGTESVRKALDTLGYKTYHHMLTRDAGHHGLWEKVYKTRGMCRESVQAALDAMDGDGYNASIDLPVNLLYREQLARHPDAKVILSVRDSADEWAEIYMSTVGALFAHMARPPFTFFVPWMQDWLSFLSKRTGIVHSASDMTPVAASLPKAYTEWAAEVRSTVPPKQLLEYHPRQGWPPLCDFLGVPPTECPTAPYP